MKLAIAIVTYNNEEHINRNLGTLFASDIPSDTRVEIINNHSNFHLHDEFQNRVTVLHNYLRPDWSTGHISRDYNSALVRNFVSLVEPAVEWVVTSQDDVVWKPDWFSRMMQISHDRNFNFITSGIGDSIVAVTAEAIRNVGLWDERICNIGWHEGDLWTRAVMWNRGRSSINDWGHGRLLNPCDEGRMGEEPGQPAHGIARLDSIFIQQPYRNEDQNKAIDPRRWVNEWTIPVWADKWGSIEATYWGRILDNPPARPPGKSYIFYPYFEKDVYNLKEKGYVVP